MTAAWFSSSGPGPLCREQPPTPARVYDYLLGGKDHALCDRVFGDRLKDVSPGIVAAVRANRAFLGRVVHHLTEQGIDQFIDIGTGLPTRSNVHEIAQRTNPAARVVYADNDPSVLAHARALLATNDNTTVIAADLRTPGAILSHPDVRAWIDFDRPFAVLMLAVLHFVTDTDDPYGIVGKFREAMPSGSYLAISHAVPAPGVDKVAAMYTREATEPGVPRTPEQIAEFFDGFDLTEPGLVPVNHWPASTEDPAVWVYGGIGRRP